MNFLVFHRHWAYFLRIFLVAVFFFGAFQVFLSPASASQPMLRSAVQELAKWEGHPAKFRVAEIYRTYNVLLRYDTSSQWQVQDIESIAAGLDAMPREVIQQLPSPINLELRPNACLFGMGRYSKACPSFDDEKRTFYLYDVPPIQGDGAVERLRNLNDEERRDIQRRRAIVHMVIALADTQHSWSEQRAWRSINGWPKGNAEPLNKDSWGYSRYLGARSAHLDLVTFAEEFFVRPEDILRDSNSPTASKRLEAIDPNAMLQCQQFTKIRVFSNLLKVSAPAWQSPYEELFAQCTEFIKWANYKNLAGVDILLAAATSDRPESLYGHLLLHVRYKSDGVVHSEGFEPVYQFGAVTDTNVSTLDYFGKGLFGGFYSVLDVNTFRGTDRLFLQFEQRTLRRFGLNLTEEQSLQLLQRIWEAERSLKYPYYFLSKNCASFLLDLIEPALDVPFPARSRFIVMPTDVLDILANITNGTRGPLLIKRPEDILSNREAAQDAVQKRRSAMRELITTLELTTAQAQQLRQLDRELDARQPEVRRESYQALQKIFVELFSSLKQSQDSLSGPQTKSLQLAIDYLYHCSRIERYFMEVAFFQTRMLYSATQLSPVTYTAEELLEMRRGIYRVEDLETRRQKRNEFAVAGDSRLQSGARRQFTPEEQAIIDNETRHREAFWAALEAQTALIDRFYPDWDGVGYLSSHAAAFHHELRERDKRSFLASGKSRVKIGWATGNESPTAGTLNFRYAYIYDRLGELRRRGYRPDIESQALSLELDIPLLRDGYRKMFAELVIFRFMSIEQIMGPVRESWTDSLGWHSDVRARHDNRRGLYFGLEASGSYNYPLVKAHHIATFLVIGAGPEIRADVARENLYTAGLQAYVLGQLHLYGHYANVLRLKLQSSQLASHRGTWQYDIHANLSTEHRLFDVGQYSLLLKPHIDYLFTTMQYRVDHASFSDWKAGMRIELPF